MRRTKPGDPPKSAADKSAKERGEHECLKISKSTMPSNTLKKNKRPECFGQIDTVFPRGEDGLRHSPETCLECPHKTDCLRTGLKGKSGLKVHAEHVDRSYDSGMIGFVERWSQKKAIDRSKHGPGSSKIRHLLGKFRMKLSN